MRAIWIAAGFGILGATGCASTMGSGMRSAETARDLALQGPPSVRIMATTVVNSHLNPLVPVHMAADKGAVGVTFGSSHEQANARLDPASLAILSAHRDGPAEPQRDAEWGTSRASLEGGHFIECWTEQTADGGRRAMARLRADDGHALGAAVPISAPDVDVLGAPHVISVDGERAVVTFASTAGQAFELRAVSLEDLSTPFEQILATR